MGNPRIDPFRIDVPDTTLDKWTDLRARLFEAVYDRDRLLTEVMIFLVTDTVATAMWPYAGFATEPFGLAPGQTISVPFGYSSFPDPLMPRMPRRFGSDRAPTSGSGASTTPADTFRCWSRRTRWPRIFVPSLRR